jgi:hypothetical protein
MRCRDDGCKYLRGGLLLLQKQLTNLVVHLCELLNHQSPLLLAQLHHRRVNLRRFDVLSVGSLETHSLHFDQIHDPLQSILDTDGHLRSIFSICSLHWESNFARMAEALTKSFSLNLNPQPSALSPQPHTLSTPHLDSRSIEEELLLQLFDNPPRVASHTVHLVDKSDAWHT